MKITRSLRTTSLLALALAAAPAGCLGDLDADPADEADIARSESELAGDICFTFYEHVDFRGATYSGCVSPGGPRCANILGFLDNRASSYTSNALHGVQLFDGAACSGTPYFGNNASSISNLHSFGAADRATSARFFP